MILTSAIICIFLSEWFFLVQKDVEQALFIGLWPPTIISLLNFFNSKNK